MSMHVEASSVSSEFKLWKKSRMTPFCIMVMIQKLCLCLTIVVGQSVTDFNVFIWTKLVQFFMTFYFFLRYSSGQ